MKDWTPLERALLWMSVILWTPMLVWALVIGAGFSDF